MPTYKHQLGTNKRLPHIHIPRTAGRFIQQQLWKLFGKLKLNTKFGLK